MYTVELCRPLLHPDVHSILRSLSLSHSLSLSPLPPLTHSPLPPSLPPSLLVLLPPSLTLHLAPSSLSPLPPLTSDSGETSQMQLRGYRPDSPVSRASSPVRRILTSFVKRGESQARTRRSPSRKIVEFDLSPTATETQSRPPTSAALLRAHALPVAAPSLPPPKALLQVGGGGGNGMASFTTMSMAIPPYVVEGGMLTSDSLPSSASASGVGAGGARSMFSGGIVAHVSDDDSDSDVGR